MYTDIYKKKYIYLHIFTQKLFQFQGGRIDSTHSSLRNTLSLLERSDVIKRSKFTQKVKVNQKVKGYQKMLRLMKNKPGSSKVVIVVAGMYNDIKIM